MRFPMLITAWGGDERSERLRTGSGNPAHKNYTLSNLKLGILYLEKLKQLKEAPDDTTLHKVSSRPKIAE